MLLINCKVELKLKWTKYCVFSADGIDNDISFIGKNLKDQFIGMVITQKVRRKIHQINIGIFSNQTCWSQHIICSGLYKLSQKVQSKTIM